MQNLLAVMAGGAIGAGIRHLANVAIPRLLGANFPWHTLLINVIGSFAMGALVSWLALRSDDTTTLRLFLATGVLGGFTTFSAFSLDFAALVESGSPAAAFAYVGGSVFLSLVAIFLGLWLVRSFA